MEFVKTELIVNHLAGVANSINDVDKNIQLIEGIAEIEINGTHYQVQIILEPIQRNWAKENETVIRKIED